MLVLGATDTPEDLEEHRVIERLRDAGCTSDILVPYRLAPSYVLGDVSQDLRADLLADGERTRRVWLAISAGGLVAFNYARDYPGDVDRIVAFAPFLGPGLIIDEIEEAGGLARWTPSEPIEEIERTWVWLRGYAEGASRPRLELLWGDEDPGAKALSLLAAALPEEDRFRGAGDHGWPTFLSLLESYLEARSAEEL